MNEDLVTELRLIGCHQNGDARCTCNVGQEAADRIEALAARIAALEAERGRLLPWAVIGAVLSSSDDGSEIPEGLPMPDLTFDPRAALAETEGECEPFQPRVRPWMTACFGPEISMDKQERNHRFIEESLELVQANGCTQSEAHQLVDYVFNRDRGEINQEIGGVMVTLAALCLAVDEDMHAAGEKELARVWTKIEKIRAKQAAKPKNSPLPQAETEGE